MFKRYAIVQQNDQNDCGAAALATVAMSYGIPIPLQQMCDLTGTDEAGTNLRGLVAAAENLGFSAQAVRGPFQALSKVPLPAIAHTKSDEGLGHFVVLHQVRTGSVVVADPARGVEKLSRKAFCQRWTGHLVLMTPQQTPPSTPTGATPIRPLYRFFGLLRFHHSLLAEAICCALFMMLLGLCSSYFIQHLIDSVLARNEVRLLNLLGIGMLLVVMFKMLFGIVRQYLLAHIGRKVDLSLVSGYTRHILGLPMQFFEMRQVGDIHSRVDDADKVREAISGTTLTVVVDGILVVTSLVVLWFYDGPLALLATVFVPILALGAVAHHSAARRRSREAMENEACHAAHLVEDISGVETIKAFGAERARSEERDDHLVNLVQSDFSLEKLAISMQSFGTLVTGTAGMVILWYGGHRVMAGALSIGQLMFFYTLLGNLLSPIERLASINLSIQDALVAVDRLYEIMDLKTEQLHEKKKVHFDGVRDAIELRDVFFKYGCRDNVLEKVNIRISGGSTIAIVGASGSGKSTLLKLMMRFYDPNDGQILIDGLDIRDFELASLRLQIGVVSQDPFIFSGTVYKNIVLGRPEASMAEVVEAARAAGIDQFISGLPERYETVIGERGANLSGGQRQRLAIARALLRKPEILIFDEATSHLDTTTEQAIQQSLTTALARKTVILVAHRLSTVKQADRIYVMEGGRIVEEGTHQELIKQGKRYRKLWQAQTDNTSNGTESGLSLNLKNGDEITNSILKV